MSPQGYAATQEAGEFTENGVRWQGSIRGSCALYAVEPEDSDMAWELVRDCVGRRAHRGRALWVENCSEAGNS